MSGREADRPADPHYSGSGVLGFSWGRHGPRTEVRRHGDERVFAYAAPLKRSLWSRVTGGK